MDLADYVAEDVGDGDVTTEALGIDAPALGRIQVNETAVLAGVDEASRLIVDAEAEPEARVMDGERADDGDVVLTARGDAAALLRIERVLLNVLGRMSGIATRTRRTVNRVRQAGADVVVAATRKTTPGFRDAEKRAVVLGGGDPHRLRLDDAILIKENHLEFVGVADAVRAAGATGMRVAIEAETTGEALDAARAGADRILLDNFAPDELAEAAARIRERHADVVLEASGGITPDNVADYAPHVDVVSLGSLTTRADWIDLSMYLDPL